MISIICLLNEGHSKNRGMELELKIIFWLTSWALTWKAVLCIIITNNNVKWLVDKMFWVFFFFILVGCDQKLQDHPQTISAKNRAHKFHKLPMVCNLSQLKCSQILHQSSNDLDCPLLPALFSCFIWLNENQLYIVKTHTVSEWWNCEELCGNYWILDL